MQKQDQTQQDRELLLAYNIERLRRQLDMFQKMLSKKGTDLSLADFDSATEEVIGDAFGSSSEMLEVYAYAKLGEAAGWMNLPEEAQLPGDQDTEQLSLHQRQRVLERCIVELESRRANLAKKE